VCDSEAVLNTFDVAFLDHESCIMELESDLASCMRCKFRIYQHLSILEKGKAGPLPCLLDSDSPFCGVERCQHIAGERGTLYPRLSQHLQMACWSSGPPCEENCEFWAGDGSEGCLMRLISIEDVTMSPPLALSSSKEGEYHKAPIELGGITEVSNEDLDLAEEKRGSDWEYFQ
jgi:hypothetical protein